ncbi:ribulose bisphosphate carboxylase small subunit [Sesbania bispinosa]|nr:ribulose bisphosphate carboxylase small subunit [Sesbania bispinosa]
MKLAKVIQGNNSTGSISHMPKLVSDKLMIDLSSNRSSNWSCKVRYTNDPLSPTISDQATKPNRSRIAKATSIHIYSNTILSKSNQLNHFSLSFLRSPSAYSLIELDESGTICD